MVNVPRTSPVAVAYRNNRITAGNASGYLLQLGTEEPSALDHLFDGRSSSIRTSWMP